MNISTSHSGTIITFYSYKGGTGRSMAVANIACLLAQRFVLPPQRILVMDWDLEAPGLHRFFSPESERPENATRPGVIDYFYALRQLLSETTDTYEKIASAGGLKVLDRALSIDDYLILDVVPRIDLMKAGRLFDEQYTEMVSSFDWAEFYDQFGSAVEAFRDLLVSRYAYCLIDSRAGFTDTSGICTMLLPEKLVAVFTPNRQSLYGLLDLVARAVEYRRASDDFRPLAVFPLPSRIELAEKKLRDQWRRDYQRAFEDTFRRVYEVAACDLSTYFGEVQIPHVSYYAFGERVAVLEGKRSDALSLSRRYEVFLQRLIELDFAWEEPEDVEFTRVVEKEPLVQRLEDIRPGAEDAEAYEQCVFEILSRVLAGQLTHPERESRTGDGIMRPDIIFFNASSHEFWQMVGMRHAATNIVFECKNTEKLVMNHVNQLVGYLGPAMGNFGVIVSRLPPGDNVKRKAITAFRFNAKIVLFLSDEDLAEMARLHAQGGDPTGVITRKYVELTRAV